MNVKWWNRQNFSVTGNKINFEKRKILPVVLDQLFLSLLHLLVETAKGN